jgi:hypothetical protein
MFYGLICTRLSRTKNASVPTYKVRMPQVDMIQLTPDQILHHFFSLRPVFVQYSRGNLQHPAS